DATIIGLAHVGKTTLLEALAGREIAAGIATVPVRDARLDALTAIFNPKKTVYAEFRLREAMWPGTDSGRKNEMERYIQNVRGAKVFLHVLAAMQTPMMTEGANPVRDLEKLDSEMIFADLVSLDRYLEKNRKAKIDPNLEKLIVRLKEELENETPLWTVEMTEAEEALLAGFNLVTRTPQLIVVNTDEGADDYDASAFGKLNGRHVVSMNFPMAKEISFLPREEQFVFAQEMGMEGPAADRVSKEVFRQLDLISFFTVGEDECRAWPITRGTTAKRAAGQIHSDIERGFIRAELAGYDDFMARKSLKQCKDDGVLRLEGKEYVVADGDIINFRFNV
ncbi:DUF933 domain-containing protein, partial [bacterium]|nr:DUF933 domain-containing protein [bacterium]